MHIKSIYACPFPDSALEANECVDILSTALYQGIPEEVFTSKIRLIRKQCGDKTPKLYSQIKLLYWTNEVVDNSQPRLLPTYKRGQR